MIRKLEKLLYNIRSTEGNEGENESVVEEPGSSAGNGRRFVSNFLSCHTGLFIILLSL